MAEYRTPEHVLYGENALTEAGSLLKEYGKKALIVTGKHVVKSPMMDKLKKLLNEQKIEGVIYDDITGEPDLKMIERGYHLFLEEKCDFLIGIGGGSPMDSAKAIAASVISKGDLVKLNGTEIKGDVPPVVAIPTTAGTGSEATKFFCVTDAVNNIKMLLKGDCLIPKIAVINPDFTSDMPKSVTVSTGLDALTHAIEAYISKKAFPLTDIYATDAVKRILKYLPIAYSNGYDTQAREEMSIAAYEAGICICNSSVTIVHGMSRPIGALFHVSHGISNAMIMVPCLRFVMDGALDRFASLARMAGVANVCDTDSKAAEKLMEAIAVCCRYCEVPTLREYGIDADEFKTVIPKMAKDAIASGSPGNSIKKVTAADCEKIYEELIEA